jgi:hypothetical protein
MTDDDSVIFGGNVEKTRYDASRSMKITTDVPVITLAEARVKNPEATIDYLVDRKEFYKRIATQYFQRINVAEKKLAEIQIALNSKDEELQIVNRLSKHFKSKYKKEMKMKSSWRFACIGTGIGTAFLTMLFIVISINKQQMPVRNDITKVPTSGTFQTTPAHILASVNIFNGSIQGSGTVISKGKNKAAILTAAHNFSGKVGGDFFVYYPDGTYTKATLIAHDPTRDLALASVDADTIIEHSYVPDKIAETGILSGVGYTGGQGPNYRTLSYTSAYYNSSNRRMWEMNVTAGPFWDGDSGGGVFQNEAIIGVTSQRDSLVSIGNNTYVRRMYACSHSEIVSFLNENKKALMDCGDWSEKPELKYSGDGPPLWKPTPNVPIHVSSNNQTLKGLRDDLETVKKKLIADNAILKTKVTDEGLKKPSEINGK